MKKSYADAQELSPVAALLYQAEYKHDSCVFSYMPDGEVISNYYTFGQLDREARRIASMLQDLPVASRILLLFPQGLEFVAAFYGCLYAGMTAVPAYPPRANQKLHRLSAIVRDSGATLALSTVSWLERFQNQFEGRQFAGLRWMASDNKHGDAEQWHGLERDGNDIAFLQYTSGSTGEPKGVRVSYDNIFHNQKLITRSFQHPENANSVCWLPLYHDMGLIGNVIQTVYLGVHNILMSPVSFLQKPYRWLKAIDEYQAATSGGPNFAYDLCVDKVTPDQRDSLDLSCWQLAYNGAEPVRADTLRRFSEHFKTCGFSDSAFFPCYGMAETTIFISGGDRQGGFETVTADKNALSDNRVIAVESGNHNGVQLVSSGHLWDGMDVAIVHPGTNCSCAELEIGEIWVKGDSVARGYENKTKESDRSFNAHIVDLDNGPYLRTGDLGFLQANSLFVTGRLKDLIIVRGKNHYPGDIEITAAASHRALRKYAGAAFQVETRSKIQLVIIQELERKYLREFDSSEIATSVRQAVSAKHEITVDCLVLIKTNSLPKASSGKVQRRLCRSRYLADDLPVLALDRLDEINPQTSEQDGAFVAQLLTLDPVSRKQSLALYLNNTIQNSIGYRLPDNVTADDNVFDYGVDSVATVDIKSRLEDDLQLELPISLLWNYKTLNALVEYLDSQLVEKKGKAGDDDKLAEFLRQFEGV